MTTLHGRGTHAHGTSTHAHEEGGACKRATYIDAQRLDQYSHELQRLLSLFCLWEESLGVLFENRPALYFSNYQKKNKNNTRMLDTLFIDDFIDIMEQYFHY